MTSFDHLFALSIAVAALAASAGCRAADTAAEHGGTGRPPVAVSVAPVDICELTETVDAVGSLAPKFSADVKSEISGIVTAVFVTEWVAVTKGARLAQLDTNETEAAIDGLKAAEAQARVVEARARREHARALQLEGYGLITPQALDEARTALEAAEAGSSAARAQVRTSEARLAKASINAPMDGVVALRRVNVGDRVENIGGSEPLFRIVDNRLLEATFTLPTSRLAAVRLGQRLEFTTDARPGRAFAGTVMFINPAIDEASRSARIVAHVRNADGALKGGLFVQGQIVTAVRNQVLQVPREALLNWKVAERVADLFVVRDGRAERRHVTTGTATERMVEIAAGVVRGEAVVTRGAFALRDGDRVTTAGAGA